MLFIAVALAFGIAAATQYSLGTAASIGPGYFPLLLSIVLALLGTAILLQGIRQRAHAPKPRAVVAVDRRACRALAFVLLANVAFGVLIGGIPALGLPPQGLIVSVYAVVFLASLASGEHRTKAALLLATVLALGSCAVFIVAMGLPVPAWPSYAPF